MESKRDFFSRVLASCVLLFAMGISGCGGEQNGDVVGDVAGRITVAGEPLTEGSLAFLNTKTGRSGSSKIGADGSYAISNLLVGTYQVLILPPPMPPPQLDRRAPLPDRSGFPMNYRTESMSKLTAAVKEGDNEAVDFDLQL